MERIIIKHLSGSKASQVTTFPLDQTREITFGRDATCTVVYEAQQDDAVGRHHAKIEPDALHRDNFILIDLDSKNGVFVNKVRITGRVSLQHDDVVQLGTGGPEFCFQQDPPPSIATKMTRMIDLGRAAPTREISIPPASTNAMPKRVVLKHLSGSKANQEVTFPIQQITEITLGRDPASTISYDAERDDTVSRNHARLARDPDQDKFTVHDLGSSNGVFVNGARISGSIVLRHGDVIRLGALGPELAFQLDPPPSPELRPTRLFEPRQAQPAATREEAVFPIATAAPTARPLPTAVESTAAQRGVSKETVERLISGTKAESRKSLINTVAALLAVVALGAGVFVYQKEKIDETRSEVVTTASKVHETGAKVAETAKAVKAMQDVVTPKEIAATYGASTVYIEASWKLIDTETGLPVYHKHYKGKAVYFELPSGVIEPALVTDTKDNLPVGGTHTGSGFAVQENGFILTCRHVAAPWKAAYQLRPGILVDYPSMKLLRNFDPAKEMRDPSTHELRPWIPENSMLVARRAGVQKQLEGRNDRLDVTFASTKLRFPAKLARVSDEHDAALVKIDTATVVKPTPLAIGANYQEVQSGDQITVLGYPGASPQVYVAGMSKDMFDQGVKVVDVPVPTVTPGAVGKVIQGTERAVGTKKYDYYSESDSYQLTVNATGPGNSGGPVFDEHGRVVGIFYAGNQIITFAVPIKYGKELMEVNAVLK